MCWPLIHRNTDTISVLDVPRALLEVVLVDEVDLAHELTLVVSTVLLVDDVLGIVPASDLSQHGSQHRRKTWNILAPGETNNTTSRVHLYQWNLKYQNRSRTTRDKQPETDTRRNEPKQRILKF